MPWSDTVMQRAARVVVDELRVDVLQRAEHHEARTLRRARDLLAHAQVATLRAAPRRSSESPILRHYLPPALPAFRRIISPAYLMPLPLYGSGGRRLRISAATWPTISLSAPSIDDLRRLRRRELDPRRRLVLDRVREAERRAAARTGCTSAL